METMDKLYLEIATITKARNFREIEIAKKAQILKKKLEEVGPDKIDLSLKMVLWDIVEDIVNLGESLPTRYQWHNLPMRKAKEI